MPLSALVDGLLAGYGIAIPVGAVSILIANTAIRYGFGVGWAAGAGAATADLLYAVLAKSGGCGTKRLAQAPGCSHAGPWRVGARRSGGLGIVAGAQPSRPRRGPNGSACTPWGVYAIRRHHDGQSLDHRPPHSPDPGQGLGSRGRLAGCRLSIRARRRGRLLLRARFLGGGRWDDAQSTGAAYSLCRDDRG